MYFLFVILSAFALCECKEKPSAVIITEENWSNMLEGECYAPWCPACSSLKPVWKEVAGWSDDLELNVGQVDVTENPGLSGRFLVTSLPTIYHVHNGLFRVYSGPRDANDIIAYVDEKKWTDASPTSWWVAPTSPQMAALGWFFRFSMTIRQVHGVMTETYGIPSWASYILFALATILCGLLMGLVIVCMCDFFNPPKQHIPGSSPNASYSREKDEDSDVIIDDRPIEKREPSGRLKDKSGAISSVRHRHQQEPDDVTD